MGNVIMYLLGLFTVPALILAAFAALMAYAYVYETWLRIKEWLS